MSWHLSTCPEEVRATPDQNLTGQNLSDGVPVQNYKSQVNIGLPQGSILGPLLFTAYTVPMGNIAQWHMLPLSC